MWPIFLAYNVVEIENKKTQFSIKYNIKVPPKDKTLTTKVSEEREYLG